MQASRLLSDAAHRFSNPRLATLAALVRLDAFTRVKKANDDLVAQLLKEKEDDIKRSDFELMSSIPTSFRPRRNNVKRRS